MRHHKLAASLSCAFAVLIAPASAQDANNAETTAEPAAESIAPPPAFDPGRMTEAPMATPALGLRYADLSALETSALRRRVALPLDALASASSPGELVNAVVVAPLPNPNQPLLKVEDVVASSHDPFGKGSMTSFRDDPLRALGEMLGAVEGEAASGASMTASGLDDPFSGDSGAASATAASEPQAEVDDSSDDDPFGGSDDPFGASGDDDPFGGF